VLVKQVRKSCILLECKTEEKLGIRGKLQSEALHGLYCLPNIIGK